MGSLGAHVPRVQIEEMGGLTVDYTDEFGGNLLTLDYANSSHRLQKTPSQYSRKSNHRIGPLEARMSNTSRISQISTRVPVNTRQSNLQLNKMDEGAFRNMSFSR